MAVTHCRSRFSWRATCLRHRSARGKQGRRRSERVGSATPRTGGHDHAPPLTPRSGGTTTSNGGTTPHNGGTAQNGGGRTSRSPRSSRSSPALSTSPRPKLSPRDAHASVRRAHTTNRVQQHSTKTRHEAGAKKAQNFSPSGCPGPATIFLF